MEVLRSIGERRRDRRASAVTIGVFDAVHRGHETLVGRVVQRASTADAVPTVVTFDPHPMVVVAPDRAPCTLATVDQRLARFEALGVERVVVLPFDAGMSKIEPEDFVARVLVEMLGAAVVLVGEDFRFGHRRRGDVALLKAEGQRSGFEVEPVPLVRSGSTDISSTTIRAMVSAGDVEGAAGLLGHRYALAGTVAVGDKRGRSMGFPTANLRPHERACLPGTGVYAGHWVWRGDRLPGVINVGVRPTFGEGQPPLVEIHVFDLDADLYGEPGEVEFVQRLRPEHRFGSVDALVAQIQRDAAAARRVLASDR